MHHFPTSFAASVHTLPGSPHVFMLSLNAISRLICTSIAAPGRLTDNAFGSLPGSLADSVSIFLSLSWPRTVLWRSLELTSKRRPVKSCWSKSSSERYVLSPLLNFKSLLNLFKSPLNLLSILFNSFIFFSSLFSFPHFCVALPPPAKIQSAQRSLPGDSPGWQGLDPDTKASGDSVPKEKPQ